MYSLVSAPVLGFDLARLEGGRATAELLLAALALVPDDLPVLAERLPDPGLRAELWQQVEAAGQRRLRVAELAGQPGVDEASTVALLERSPIGSLDALLHCLRYDVLDWTWASADGRRSQTEPASRATALLCDAAVAGYLRGELAEPTRRRLAAGWVAAARRVPARPVDLGPQHRSIVRWLDRLRQLGPAELARLAAGGGAGRSHAEWPTAMHSASWAVYLAGRVRAAAAAQLRLAVAVSDAGMPVPVLAAGGWNALSGVAQALVARDLLDLDSTHLLLQPYLAALGPAGLD